MFWPTQVGELDANFDGLPDVIHFQAKLASLSPVHGVKLLLQFSYSLHSTARMKMIGRVYVEAASPLPGASLHVDGQVRRHRRAACNAIWDSASSLIKLKKQCDQSATVLRGANTCNTLMPNSTLRHLASWRCNKRRP